MRRHFSRHFAPEVTTLAVTRTVFFFFFSSISSDLGGIRNDSHAHSVNLMVQMFGKNGGIDIDGFVLLFKYIQAIRTSFETLDKNKSGSLTAEEIKHAITKAGFAFKNDQTFNAIFTRYDSYYNIHQRACS